MKRKATIPGMVRYIKNGGGSLRLPNRIIKPNEVFDAYPEDIPETFRDMIVPLDGEVKKQQEAVVQVSVPKAEKLEYFTKLRGGGYYNVVDTNGKVMNEKALRKDAAEDLIKSLTA